MIIIKYGGSILNPDGQYSDVAIAKLIELLKADPTQMFCFIVGGGHVCRQLQDAAQTILEPLLTKEQITVARDEIGIASTKINAKYLLDKLLPLFEGKVCPQLVTDPHTQPPTGFAVYLATGALPGHSTDYDMMVLAKTFRADRAIKISDFPMVLDVKPADFNKELIAEYQPLPKITWSKLNELVGEDWVPGGNYPLDPAACKIGKELAFKGFSLMIGQYEQLEKMVANKDFSGTLVQGR